MTKVILRNAWGFEPLESDFEHPTGESMTVPDDSYSISEILEKFTSGVSLNIAKEGDYSDTDDYDDVNPFDSPDFDLTDIDEMKNEIDEKQDIISKFEEQQRKKEAQRSDDEENPQIKNNKKEKIKPKIEDLENDSLHDTSD